jgi:3'(2'), 5'-bisphosphate nucleotidase
MAKQLRRFDISVPGKKNSGYANADALTLADLSVQELLVGALRDSDPLFRHCRLEAEEASGDLAYFATDADYTITLDPIDGTEKYRDHTGDGWCVMLNLRSVETVHYSLVYIPQVGPHGTWVEAVGNRISCGEDDPHRPATDVLRDLLPIDSTTRPDAKAIRLSPPLDTPDNLQVLADTGLEPITSVPASGNLYDLFARGAVGGQIIHTPNVYDFPVFLHIARILGGDAHWVHTQQPVNFHDVWFDERVEMLRLPGIVACSVNRETLATLCALAKDWDPRRYRD